MSRRLAALAEASARIFAAQSMGESLRLITEEARAIIGAHQSVTSLTVGDDWARRPERLAIRQNRGLAQLRPEAAAKGIYAVVCRENARAVHAGQLGRMRWHNYGEATGRHPPMRAGSRPALGRDGVNLGLGSFRKYEGEFDDDDETCWSRAHLAALGIE